ncbi:50S ribosomal protein L14 [Frankliniella fusca]|uniref:50S ribosomal protein L14 n=1 Tax=Frankliniella fusca TaxID=407009 RepID=A0AAE1HGJ6_9NEOP|nr:50S ribosomal protein L14 [Frankliniella fusca]
MFLTAVPMDEREHCRSDEALLVAVLGWNGISHLELGELIGPEVLPGQYEAHDVLRQQCERPQVEHLVAVLVDKL